MNKFATLSIIDEDILIISTFYRIFLSKEKLRNYLMDLWFYEFLNMVLNVEAYFKSLLVRKMCFETTTFSSFSLYPLSGYQAVVD